MDDETVFGIACLKTLSILDDPTWTVAQGPYGMILERKDGEVYFHLPGMPKLSDEAV